MLQKSPKCAGCPFETRGRGYVPGQGSHRPRVILIGQGPGQTEVQRGEPFCIDAPAGKRLTQWLYAAQLPPREECWIDNAVRCLIKTGKGDEAPPAAVRECWRRHLGPTLGELLAGRDPAPPVVALGSPASRSLAGSWAGEGAAGSFVRTNLEIPNEWC